MSAEPQTTSKGQRPWLRVLLGVSLSLNLLVAGLVARAEVAADPHEAVAGFAEAVGDRDLVVDEAFDRSGNAGGIDIAQRDHLLADKFQLVRLEQAEQLGRFIVIHQHQDDGGAFGIAGSGGEGAH